MYFKFAQIHLHLAKQIADSAPVKGHYFGLTNWSTDSQDDTIGAT